MRHASLFSGIGGPEVAAAMMGWENAFHCEINPFGRAVLEYWFPNSKSYEDITKTDFKEWRGKVDVLTGGFPCQPFSYAGKRGGRDDERYLWPEMLRVIDEVRPTWVVGENVAGITTMVEGGILTPMGSDTTLFGEGDGLHRYELRQSFTIERICRDLEGLGYSVQPVLIPAAAVGAPHRRDRVFIIAHSDERGGSPQGTDSAGDRPGADILPGKAGQREGHAPVWADGLSPVQGAAQDTLGDGCRLGADDQQGGVRHVGDAGAGDDERVCGEERIPASHSLSEGTRSISGSSCDKGRESGEDWGEGIRQAHGTSGSSGAVAAGLHASDPDGDRGDEVHEHLQRELADGSEPVSDGGKRDVTHSYGAGLQEAGTELEAAGDRRDCEETIADTNRSGQSASASEDRFNGEESVARGRSFTFPGTVRPRTSRSSADPYGQGREESQQPGRGENCEENEGGMDDRAERSGGYGESSDTFRKRLERENESGSEEGGERVRLRGDFAGYDWTYLRPENRWRDFPTVSPVHAGNDGLPFRMDGASIPFGKWRTEALKAYGNAIVPQVMYRIFQAIEKADDNECLF